MSASPTALEVQFNGELQHAWIIRLRNLAKRRGVDVLVQRSVTDKKVGFIENVERFHPELQIGRLVNLRPLDESEVEVPDTRVHERIRVVCRLKPKVN